MTSALRRFVSSLQDSTSCVPLHLNTMFSNTIIGNVVHTEVVKSQYQDGDYLAITLAVEDLNGNSIRVRFNNSNGLLTAYKNGTLVGGTQLILTQFDVKLDSIKSHYIKDGSLAPLKFAQVSLSNVRAIIGSIPMGKRNQEATQTAPAAPQPAEEALAF